MHLELALEVLAPDLRDRREAGREAGGIEETVEPAELEHRPAEERVQAGVAPDVGLHADDPPGERGRELARHRLGAAASRSDTTTWAPSSANRFAAARPMPLPPPITTATCRGSSLPASSRASVSSTFRRSSGQCSNSKTSASLTNWNRSTASAPAIASSVAR